MAEASSGERVNLLLRFLAGIEPASGAPLRESDEILVDILAGLPREGELTAMLDRVGAELLDRADRPVASDGSPPDRAEEVVLREATFRLLRVVRSLPDSLPRCVAATRDALDAQSPALLQTSESQDVAAEALQVLVTTQHDNRYVPLWWRLCDLESLSPRHSAVGVLGLRWSPAGDRDLESLLAHAFSRIANASARASTEQLLSDTASRRNFLSCVRVTRGERRDLAWATIGVRALSESTPGPAEAMVRRAFGIEGTLDRDLDRGTGRYEDPDRARDIAARLEANAPTALASAREFLDAQRSHASQGGGALPFVQSLCFFASRVKQHRTDVAIEWAREAASWQPHNRYPTVILAEALVASGRPDVATDALLRQLFRLAEHSSVWVELGRLLAEQGEHPAALETLQESTERFPDEPYAWSALGEYHVRVGCFAAAAEAFDAGLNADPSNRYLLPGLVRALGLAGQMERARAVMDQAYAALGAGSRILEIRRKALETGDYGVVPLPAGPIAWRAALSNEALGALALLYRRAARRKALVGDSPAAVLGERQEVLARIHVEHGVGLAVASELALGGIGGSYGETLSAARAAPPVRELLRTRVAREESKGHTYTRNRFDTLTFDTGRAAVADQRLAPLHELSRLRAVATLVDGSDLARHGTNAIATLIALKGAARALRPDSNEEPSVGERRSAWAKAVLAVLSVTSADDSAWQLRMGERSFQLDAVESNVAIGVMT